jgi:hypothetical protein
MVVSKCAKCGGDLNVETLPTFQADSIGIRGVEVIDAVQQASCVKCEAVAYTMIPDLPELIAAVAVWRVMIPVKLVDFEIKFLRQALNLQSKELAEKLQVTPETVSRWENRQSPISDGSERSLRVLVGDRLQEQAPGIRFEPSAVATMKLQGPRPQLVIPMSFCRVLVNPEQEAWNPRRVATG